MGRGWGGEVVKTWSFGCQLRIEPTFSVPQSGKEKTNMTASRGAEIRSKRSTYAV